MSVPALDSTCHFSLAKRKKQKKQRAPLISVLDQRLKATHAKKSGAPQLVVRDPGCRTPLKLPWLARPAELEVMA